MNVMNRVVNMPRPCRVNIPKAIESKMKGQSYNSIARDQKVAVSSVHQVLAPIFAKLSGTEHLELYQKNQAQVFDSVGAAIVASITDDDLSKATLQQKVTSIGIITDKARLVSGQSTANLGISVLLQGVASAALIHAAGDKSAVIDGEVLVD